MQVGIFKMVRNVLMTKVKVEYEAPGICIGFLGGVSKVLNFTLV